MSEVKRHDAIQGEIIHVYDGIEEADNRLPMWWLWTFFLTIGFSAIYWANYHLLQVSKLPMDAYQAELAQTSGGKVTEEMLAAVAQDKKAIEEGKALFATNCVVCHEANGQGKIGANLTDKYWIHGGAPLDIHKVVSEGVSAKGMPAWGQTLGPVAVQKLVAFVLSIRDTNVAGKEPQGEVWPKE